MNKKKKKNNEAINATKAAPATTTFIRKRLAVGQHTACNKTDIELSKFLNFKIARLPFAAAEGTGRTLKYIYSIKSIDFRYL